MPTNIPVDGNNFSIDNQGELGANQQTRLISILQARAQRLFYLSPTAAAAVSGILRLAKTDWAAWRNNANNADLLLQIGNPTNNSGVANDALSFKGQLLSDQPFAEYNTTAGPSMANGANTVVNFNTLVTDTDNAVTTGAAWKFTVPAGKGGRYLVSVVATLTGLTADTGLIAINVQKNTVNIATGYQTTAKNGTTLGLTASAEILCVAGDQLGVVIFQNNGGARNLSANAPENRITVQRLP